MTKDIVTCNHNRGRNSIDNNFYSIFSRCARIICVRSDCFKCIGAGVGQGCGINGIGHTRNRSAIHIPCIRNLAQSSIRFIGIIDLELSHTIQTNCIRCGDQNQVLQFGNMERILVGHQCHLCRISIASIVLVNRNNFIDITTCRVSDCHSINISDGGVVCGSVDPFPHVGLD